MKTLLTILLVILLVTPAFASSTCDINTEKASNLSVEGGELSEEGSSYYNQYLDALDGTPQDIKSALKLLNSAIVKARAAKDKYIESNYFIEKAQQSCSGIDLSIANAVALHIQSAIESVNKELSPREVNDDSLIWTNQYVFEKYQCLSNFIHANKTNAAIYWIENGNINLNYRSETEDPLLIIAAKNGALDIVKSLVIHGADIDISENDYTALEIAGIRGDFAMFRYLFNKKASPFLLKGFKRNSLYNQCNFADLVNISANSGTMGGELTMSNEHNLILAFLKNQGLVPVFSQVVATVNGQKIKKSDVNFVFVATVLPKFQAQNPGQEMPAELKNKIKNEIIGHLINQELLVQAADRAQIEPDKNLVQQQLSRMLNRLPHALYEHNKEQIIDYMTRENMTQEVINKEVISKIQIPEQKLRQYYDEHQDEFAQPERVRVLNILTQTRKQAEEVRALAKKPDSDFSELARKYSTGPSAKKGGDLGYFVRGVMVQPFDEGVFSLKTGEISPIIQTNFGYHIVKMIDKKSAGAVPFIEVKDRLEDWVKSQDSGEKVEKWINSLRDKATIVTEQSVGG